VCFGEVIGLTGCGFGEVIGVDRLWFWGMIGVDRVVVLGKCAGGWVDVALATPASPKRLDCV
jgi:hypothetical protein